MTNPRLAQGIALAGHVVILATSGAIPAGTVIVAAIACSIIAIAAVPVWLVGAHAVAVVVIAVGVVPGVPWAVPLIGLALAAALDGVSLFRASIEPRVPVLAPRVAALSLIAQAFLRAWAASTTDLAGPLRTATLLAIAALAIALLASLAILMVRTRWGLVVLVAWTVGWVATTVDLGALITWSLGAPFPMGVHQLGLDPALVQIIATAGGLAIGAQLLTAIRDVRIRHSAVVLLAGYAVLGVIAAVAEHRLALTSDFPGISALRRDQHLTDELRACAFAAVLWQYGRVIRPRR